MTTVAVPATGPDHREPAARLDTLFDPASARTVHPAGTAGVEVATGRIHGRPAVGYCTDARHQGGALGAAGAANIVRAIELADRLDRPVVGLWHSGGARLADGVGSMDGVGRMFAAMTRASGRIPQVSVVLGPAAGAAAYGPALTDLVVLAGQGRMFVTGPDVVRRVTGEDVDMETLGGARAHGRNSGVAHLVAASETEALGMTRGLVDLLGRPGAVDPAATGPDHDLAALLPRSPRRAYDVRPLVRALVDGGALTELQAGWARNLLTGLGRIGGGTVGVLANNPLHKGGCLDSLSAEKAARFVRMCDAFGIPLVVMVDVPGYLPGVKQEWDGVIRRGAKLLHAFAEAVVPRVTLITRKSYGGAYIAMNSRSLGATAVLAWPGAEVDVMGAETAVEVLHRRRLAAAADPDELRARLVTEHRRTSGGVRLGIELGVVDEIVPAPRTRRRIAEILAATPPARGRHNNIPL